MSRNDDIQKRINESVESARKVVEQIPPDKRNHYGLSRYEQSISDDDEPITREWVASEFNKPSLILRCTNDIQVYLDVLKNDDTVRLHVGDDCLDQSIIAETVLPHIKTRRQFRDLLAALGYRREENK